MALLFTMGVTDAVVAKRLAPRPVTPIKIGGVEYRVPTDVDRLGCVEAWDIETGQMLWWRQVYVVTYQPKLEADVQWVFISEIRAEKNALRVKNERGSEYTVDLRTLEVKCTKGSALEHRDD